MPRPIGAGGRQNVRGYRGRNLPQDESVSTVYSDESRNSADSSMNEMPSTPESLVSAQGVYESDRSSSSTTVSDAAISDDDDANATTVHAVTPTPAENAVESFRRNTAGSSRQRGIWQHNGISQCWFGILIRQNSSSFSRLIDWLIDWLIDRRCRASFPSFLTFVNQDKFHFIPIILTGMVWVIEGNQMAEFYFWNKKFVVVPAHGTPINRATRRATLATPKQSAHRDISPEPLNISAVGA